MLHRFSRLEKIIGHENLSLLKTKKVLVLGCGGVGGYVIEALARSGIGTIVMVDYDKIDITNINRQIIALDSTIGKDKVDILEQRMKEINPNCKVIKIKEFIDDKNISKILDTSIDYVVDACDTVQTKKALIKECLNNNISFISSMGTGNKLDPSKLEIVDIRKTVNDPLARIIRKFVKDEKINKKIMVLSSKELPIKIEDRTPGSSAFVPASAGLLVASYVMKELIKKE
ncbi:MAG: tRNA threonylcarbamoyladenosine dehydratase [Bacilli bacterium]|nr:tRNA threonylcarbamoyladenosine dehydratase [Bacilli bacterium]